MQAIIGRFSWLSAALVLAAALLVSAGFGSPTPASAQAKPGAAFEDARELECILLGGETEWVFDEGGNYRGFVCRFADGMWWCPVDGECIRIILPTVRTEAAVVDGAHLAPQQHVGFGIGTTPGVRGIGTSPGVQVLEVARKAGGEQQQYMLLKIDGIPGESTDDSHTGEIVICIRVLGFLICF